MINQALDFASAVIIFMLAVAIHESAHAFAADKMGDPTARYLGRITLNPIPHIDLIGTIIVPILGYFAGFIIGWAKPCPVNPYNFQNPRRDQMIVAFAGPLSNILLASITSLIFIVISYTMALKGSFVESFFARMIFINVILAIFNLIPVPPLDGSWILEGLMPRSWEPAYRQIKPYGFMILLILMVTGLLWYIVGPLASLLFYLLTILWH
ncbi:MAG: hypothetical protein A2Y62_17595 [Candidatus Fischerbacteria bacterium RBG_13_37_8]|uniref:Peptidase M50 domain-containing protein n=1 Tax=Candidatus Fischerbacteria bacterium RBG_13_37_8 TaxID=1817863 RepID=A0A1F5VP21_9BACT|nr:MAG: hypothetical protein A2Y62_17595 [Candidatus Fischerbacteria bacterium RBG_13_37_8]